MNSELFNPYEGQKVETIVWPFFRYHALIPEQIGGDLFVWLYLSLVSFNNQGKGLPADNYTEDVKQDVQKVLAEKFSAVIDGQTLDKIVSNAEKDFVVDTKTSDGKKAKKIKPEAFSFIDTYENLFSDKLDVKYIYQDAITGEVLPFFGDTSDIEDSKDTERRVTVRPGVKEPSKKAVKKAYKQYIKIKKHNISGDEPEIELSDEFFDEDEQTFLDNSSEEVSFEEEKQEESSLNNYNVIFLKDKQALFNLEVPLFVEDNELKARSPFGNNTNLWMDKCMKKGRNVSEEVDAKLRDYESAFIVEERKIDNYIEGHKNDFASSLNACQSLYRMIDSLNDNRLREYVVKLDAMYSQQDELFFFYCGKYLERILKKINYNKSDANTRQLTNFDSFCREIDNRIQYRNIQYNFVKTQYIFNDWQKKYTRKDGKEYSSFKADVVDILLRTNLVDSALMYPSFFDDMFALYSTRSTVDHDDDNAVNITIGVDKVEKLLKITKVLFELI